MFFYRKNNKKTFYKRLLQLWSITTMIFPLALPRISCSVQGVLNCLIHIHSSNASDLLTSSLLKDPVINH